MNRPFAISLAAFTCGCTVYTPIAPVQAATGGQVVRVQLTEAGTVDLAQLLGGAATELVGRVDAATDSAVTLRVTLLTRMNGADETWNGEHVAVPLRDVASIQRQAVSVPRSILLGAAVVGGVIFAGKAFGRGDATGSHNTYGGGTGQ
jgi:hypothetical protein